MPYKHYIQAKRLALPSVTVHGCRYSLQGFIWGDKISREASKMLCSPADTCETQRGMTWIIQRRCPLSDYIAYSTGLLTYIPSVIAVLCHCHYVPSIQLQLIRVFRGVIKYYAVPINKKSLMEKPYLILFQSFNLAILHHVYCGGRKSEQLREPQVVVTHLAHWP